MNGKLKLFSMGVISFLLLGVSYCCAAAGESCIDTVYRTAYSTVDATAYSVRYDSGIMADICQTEIKANTLTPLDTRGGETVYLWEKNSLRPLCSPAVTEVIPEKTLVDFSDRETAESYNFEYSVSCANELLGIDGGAYYTKDASPKIQWSFSETDWSKYNTLNIEFYSCNNTGSTMTLACLSSNPETLKTDGTDLADYYRAVVPFGWEGSWQTLKYSFDFLSQKSSDLKAVGTPLGFDRMDGRISFWPRYGGTELTENSAGYFGRIYLSYEEPVKIDNSVDYIPPANSAYADVQIPDSYASHPRLATSAQRLDDNINEAYTDLENGKSTFISETARYLVEQANLAVRQEVTPYSLPDGARLQTTERELIKKLAVACVIAEDRRFESAFGELALHTSEEYFERLWQSIEEMASWKDWNDSHFLCAAEAGYAFALCYDLCYDYFDDSQKRIMRNAMMRNTVEPALRHWRHNTDFAAKTNNWQMVCSSAVGMTALCLIDENGYEDICKEVIGHSMRTLPLGLASYKYGDFPEGPVYWQYASEYFFNYEEALFNTLGTDFGLCEYEGLSETGLYPVYSVGPCGRFNYADCTNGSAVRTQVMFYLARKYNLPSLSAYLMTAQNSSWLGFLMYENLSDGKTWEEYKSGLKKDIVYNSNNPIAYMRADFNDSNSPWLAFKGGNNQSSHGDLDIGHFIYDSQGVRWFYDLGPYYYDSPGMWEFGTNGGRWKYYRKRAEAHNTVVVNPRENSGMPDQNPYAECSISDFDSSDTAACGVVDMTAAYADDSEHSYCGTVTSAKRGFALVNNRNDAVIRDEISMSESSDVYVFFTTLKESTNVSGDKVTVTSVSVETDELSPHIATLVHTTTVNGAVTKIRKLRLTAVSDATVKWNTMDATAMYTLPDDGNMREGYTDEDYQKLFLLFEDATEVNVSVIIQDVDEDICDLPEILPIGRWSEYLK